jgi:hypothetical protein
MIVVPWGVEAGQDGADGDGLAGAHFSGDDADGALADAPGDAGDGLVVGGVAVQHAGGEASAERMERSMRIRINDFLSSSDSPVIT